MFDLFFVLAPAIQAIFKLGFEPKEEFFYEFTEDQYQSFKNRGEDISSKLYLIIPDNPKYQTEESLCVNESENEALLRAVKYIENACNESGNEFVNFRDKLRFISKKLPPLFSEDSEFER